MGGYDLAPGSYQLVFNEVVDLAERSHGAGTATIESLSKRRHSLYGRLGRRISRPVDCADDGSQPGGTSYRARCSTACNWCFSHL